MSTIDFIDTRISIILIVFIDRLISETHVIQSSTSHRSLHPSNDGLEAHPQGAGRAKAVHKVRKPSLHSGATRRWRRCRKRVLLDRCSDGSREKAVRGGSFFLSNSVSCGLPLQTTCVSIWDKDTAPVRACRGQSRTWNASTFLESSVHCEGRPSCETFFCFFWMILLFLYRHYWH